MSGKYNSSGSKKDTESDKGKSGNWQSSIEHSHFSGRENIHESAAIILNYSDLSNRLIEPKIGFAEFKCKSFQYIFCGVNQNIIRGLRRYFAS